jgi:hypothetical protein
MTPQFAETDLDGELVFDRFLDVGDAIDGLQDVLVALAPRWTSKLRIWRGPKDQRPVDTERQGALSSGILAAAGERGPTYRSLVERHGVPPFERLAGSVELRGSDPGLVVVVSVDSIVVSPLGAKQQLGNRVAFQVRRPKVGRTPGDIWLSDAFELLCARLSPAWGSAGHAREYWAKVMSDPPRVEAIGRDFGRFLPGVFWLNFFGRRYRELISDDRLLSVPARKMAAVDDGVLVGLANDPGEWDTPEYAVSEHRVRDHLGVELFFSKAEPDRLTMLPIGMPESAHPSRSSMPTGRACLPCPSEEFLTLARSSDRTGQS